MKEFEIISKNKDTILALGAESAGNFSVFQNGIVYFSQNFGDLLGDTNYRKYKNELKEYLRKNKIKPDIILSDLHPLFQTTALAKELVKKYNAKYFPVQHHLAHIFSSVGDKMIQDTRYKIQDTILGIACDGTGFGFDEKIWGGEAFAITKKQETRNKQETNSKIQITRVGHLENQILLGGEMAIKEPARMLMSILAKIYQPTRVIPGSRLASMSEHLRESRRVTRNPDPYLNLDSRFHGNDNVYNYVKKFYTHNEFEVLWNQLQQNFNCLETSSTARILDAVSVLLGFSKNERLSKHGPIDLLEKNSGNAYQIKPIISFDENEKMWVLKTTPLFEYLIKNINKDKRRLAATAQKYIADGLLQIIQNTKYDIRNTYFAGGMANNKIISSILESKGFYTSKKIPRGDAGISFGQIIYYLLANSRN